MPLTRHGPSGYGIRRAGSFAGKPAPGLHPVGILTRYGTSGYGIRRSGVFSGKTPGVVGAVVDYVTHYRRGRRT